MPHARMLNLSGTSEIFDATVHEVVTEYLAHHSPVSPTVEGRAVATDAPADLLSQVEGTSYRFM